MIETLLAVAAGAVLTAARGWLADRRRSKQHDRQQWHQQRLVAYTSAWTRLGYVALSVAICPDPRLWQLPYGALRLNDTDLVDLAEVSSHLACTPSA